MQSNAILSMSGESPNDEGREETSAQRTAPPAGSRRWLLAAGIGLLVLLAAVLLTTRKSRSEPAAAPRIAADKAGVTIAEGAPQWSYVKLAVAEQATAIPPLPVPGRVGFDEQRTSNVGVPLHGRIEQVVVRLGDEVKLGDKLFSVRSGEFTDLDKEVATARESVLAKTRLRDRAKDLYGLNAIPEKDLLAAESELKEAQLELSAAEAKQRSLAVGTGGDNLFWVRAPRAGRVVSLDAVASQEVTPERDEPLLRISDTAEVLVTADVPESEAADLAPDGQALIRTRDGVERKGAIQQITSVVDPLRQTLAVRVKADNSDGALKPNAFVDVTLMPKEALRPVQLDEDAVVTDGDHSSVFVLKDSNRLEKQQVLPGRRGNGMVEVRSGVTPGTRYVAKGALLLLNQVELAD